MNLFIDTNILLSFFHLSSDDLEELRKLAVLMKNGNISLHLTEQVVNEFKRNRASKISDALKRLRDSRSAIQFPQFFKDYSHYAEIRKLIEAADKKLAELVNLIEEDITSEKLRADDIIGEIFRTVKPYPLDKSVLLEARNRVDLGNPPGKNGSLGDAVNWEVLLKSVPDNEELFFISDDGDYASPLDVSSFHPFLDNEWSLRKHSAIAFYRRLSSFLRDKFPDIKLEVELEKERTIRNLAASTSFSSTHLAVFKLSQYTDFTSSQISEIVNAALSNNQVRFILKDDDVNRFFKNLLRHREIQVDAEDLKLLTALIEDK